MTITINSDEARVRMSEILDQVSAGDHFVVARYNKPIGVLIPHNNWQSYQMYLAFEEAKRVEQELQAGHMGVVSGAEMQRLMDEKAASYVGH